MEQHHPNRRGSDHAHERIEKLRAEIEQLSPEIRMIARYIEAHADAQSAQTNELLTTFQAAKGVLVGVKWVASLLAACSVVWAGLHGVKLP